MQQLIITLMAICGLLAPLMARKLQRLALVLSQTELAAHAAAPNGTQRRKAVLQASQRARSNRARAAAWCYTDLDKPAWLQQ
ncbi:MAG: hypothetical protein V4484_04990 [Pseudomonadota bacterium]